MAEGGDERKASLGAPAVFISYASEDTEAAGRIAATLEAAGIEVWLDEGVLRTGDDSDQKIRREIRDCVLFMPVISRDHQARTEGYFRLEWHLADQRTQLIAKSRPFLIPVCIDETPEKHAEVPESFSRVHWSRLPRGEASAAFVEHVSRLLAAGHHRPQYPFPRRACCACYEWQSPTRSRWGALRRTLRWVALAGAVVLLAAAAVWRAAYPGYFWRSPLANAQFLRLTDWSGSEEAAAISRDGRTVAFIADHDGPNDVWVTEIGGGRSRNLTHGSVSDPINPEIRTLGFSADGSLVTVWARSADGSRSADINIMAVPAGGPLRAYVRGAAEVAWSSDGRRIVYHTTAPGDPMFVADSAGGAGKRIYTAPAGVHCHFQAWSPDDAFIYFARGVPPDHWDLWRIRPSGEGLERLTYHNSIVNHPVLIDAHTLLYLATDVPGAGPWLYGLDLRHHVLAPELRSRALYLASRECRRQAARGDGSESELGIVACAAAGQHDRGHRGRASVVRFCHRLFPAERPELRAVRLPAVGAARHLEARERRKSRSLGRHAGRYSERTRHRSGRTDRIHGRRRRTVVAVRYA